MTYVLKKKKKEGKKQQIKQLFRLYFLGYTVKDSGDNILLLEDSQR